MHDLFADRLRECIGEEPVAAFARRCGFSEGLVRSYLKRDKRPGMDRLIRMASAAGVTVDWLATGHGPRHRQDARISEQTPEYSAAYSSKDARRWQQIIALVESIDDDAARETLLGEIFARAQDKAEIAALHQAVRELRAASRRPA